MSLSVYNRGFKDFFFRTYNTLTDKGEIPSPLKPLYIQELRDAPCLQNLKCVSFTPPHSLES